MIFSPSQENIEIAISHLKMGNLIGLPTETVYGLAGDARNAQTVAKIFALKGRPNFNPLISHVCDIEMAKKYGEFSDTAKLLAEHFWPGAFTIVVPRLAGSEICDLTCAGLETIALRCPKHAVAQKIIKGFGAPIAAPSANISGQVSPTSAQHVKSEFGDNLPIIIDGGECQIGLESTVVAVFENEVTLLRYGAITIEEIENVIGGRVQIANLNDEKSPKSPGMLLKHYSPNAPLFLDCDKANEGEILIGFGDMLCDLNLSKTSNLQEAAANLYRMIRQADAQKPRAIKIAQIQNTGIGAAINDRLSRAAEK